MNYQANKTEKIRVLVAGIGGASLGTEILKSLLLTGRYIIYGCDISPLAFGHYQPGFERTFLVQADTYVDDIKCICKKNNIQAIVPGGEQPMVILGAYQQDFEALGIKMAFNVPDVIALCSNKDRLFDFLKNKGVHCPQTLNATSVSDLEDFPCPCVIKPATGTGGSNMVFLASNEGEARQYLSYVLSNTPVALVQEYIALDGGEFTIGVLSFPDGRVFGSIALQRIFNAKLSVSSKTQTGLISSGYSQGLIDNFQDLCAQAEHIALTVKSAGPLNVQGRVKNGRLLPFEINPRFSASTYLRALAGFNEVDIFLQYLVHGSEISVPAIKPGYYLRSLSEVHVPLELVKND